MRKWIVWSAALVIAASVGLDAQSIAGSWQGTLKIGERGLRIVFKIALDNDQLKAAMYSIDQGGQAIPATITRDGANIKIAVPAAGGTFEGKLSAEGDAITGNWSQGSPLPLTLTLATPATEWSIPEPPPPPRHMPKDAKPVFEVATIKPAGPGEGYSFLLNQSGMLNATGTSLVDMIKFAYDLHPKQIRSAATWMDDDRYSITAKPDIPGLPSLAQLKSMVQGLLKERFQLEFHLEKKELPVYAITVTKTGMKMNKDETNTTGLPGFGGGRGTLGMQNATMQEFAQFLAGNLLDRPVVDQTGLGGTRYDGRLRYTPDASTQFGGPQPGGGAPPSADSPDAPPDLFLAFQQQLGLRLEPTRAEVDVLVIDKAEKPSAN